MKKENTAFMNVLQLTTKSLGVILGLALVIASFIEIYKVFEELYSLQISAAIQDAMFVLILLEMIYVIKSFIKYGSINTSLIISVGIVTIVKEIIFNLKTLNLNSSIAFSILFIALSIGLLLENKHYNLKIDQGRKPERINPLKDLLMTNAEQIEEMEREELANQESRV